MSREHSLELRVLELEAALRKAAAALDVVESDSTHTKLRVAVRRIHELGDEVLDLRARLETAILTSIALEGECDECPEDGFHDTYAYRDAVDD